jgi:hypothetical protein
MKNLAVSPAFIARQQIAKQRRAEAEAAIREQRLWRVSDRLYKVMWLGDEWRAQKIYPQYLRLCESVGQPPEPEFVKYLAQIRG